MLSKGIENVRGGSYCDVILPEYKINALNNEFQLNKTNTLNKSNIINNIINKYKNMNDEDKNIDKNNIIKKLEDYQETKRLFNHYSKFYINSQWIHLNHKLLNNLEWLNDSITYINNNYCSKETKTIYNDTMLKLKCISKLFFERFPDYDFCPKVNYHQPQILFDPVFFNKGFFNHCEYSLNLANEVYKKYEYMYFKLLNYVDELEFDLTTFPENFEEESLLTIKYLNINPLLE